MAKTGVEVGGAAGASDARVRVAHDSRAAIDNPVRNQRLNGEVGSGRIAPLICDQARARDALAAKFRQSVNRFGEQFRPGVRLFIPARICSGVARSERATQVDDLAARVQHWWSE